MNDERLNYPVDPFDPFNLPKLHFFSRPLGSSFALFDSFNEIEMNTKVNLINGGWIKSVN
jgi:hypothetical protein